MSPVRSEVAVGTSGICAKWRISDLSSCDFLEKKVDAEKLAQKTEQTPGNPGRVDRSPALLGSEWHAQKGLGQLWTREAILV